MTRGSGTEDEEEEKEEEEEDDEDDEEEEVEVVPVIARCWGPRGRTAVVTDAVAPPGAWGIVGTA